TAADRDDPSDRDALLVECLEVVPDPVCRALQRRAVEVPPGVGQGEAGDHPPGPRVGDGGSLTVEVGQREWSADSVSLASASMSRSLKPASPVRSRTQVVTEPEEVMPPARL